MRMFVGAVVGGGVGYIVRLLQDRSSRTHARADKTRDEHRRALATLVEPIRNAYQGADRFIGMCGDVEKHRPVPDEWLSRTVRAVEIAWGSKDVSPFVTDNAVREAWNGARLSFLARRWDEARTATDKTKDERIRACCDVAVRIRNALADLRVAIRPYVTPD